MSKVHVFFHGDQPYQLREVIGAVGEKALVIQCYKCERYSHVPGTIEVGPEGPTVAHVLPVMCGHDDCRTAFIIWRGRVRER